MKTKTMKLIVYTVGLLTSALLLSLMTLSGTTFADGGDEGALQVVNGYQVRLVFIQPVAVGENPFYLQVTDAQDRPVTNAEIVVTVVEGETNHPDGGHTEATPPAAAVESPAHTEAHGASVADPHAADAPDGHNLSKLLPGTSDGEYVGTLNIPQAGQWLLRAQVVIDEMEIVFDFPVTVTPPKNGLSILAGFLAVNGVIVGVAALGRRRQTAPGQPA